MRIIGKVVWLVVFGVMCLPTRSLAEWKEGTDLMVVHVRSNDVLNIREHPTDGSRIIGIIPPGGRRIAYLGKAHGYWIFVRYGDTEGWVNRNFVVPMRAPRARCLRAKSD
jgi:hypothetical protein